MRRNRLILAALICLAALVVYLGITRRGAGPVYDGHSLEYWLEVRASGQYPDQATAAEIAVQAIGTNALPYLLKWVAYEPPKEQSPLADLVDRLRELGGLPPPRAPHLNPHDLARCGFQVLRAEAAPAVPTLTRFLSHTNSSVRWCATHALANIGSQGLPPLLDALSKTNNPGRITTVYAILEMHESYSEHSQATIPALIRCMQDPNPYVAREVIQALTLRGVQRDKVFVGLTNALASPHGMVRAEAVRAFRYPWKQEAHKAAPALRPMLNDPNPQIRDHVSVILSRIDGQARTNAPPE